MSGLILKLAPNERVLVNGVVIENGKRRAKFSVITPDANILRLREALHPDDIKGPASKMYYIAQLAVCGEADPKEAAEQLKSGCQILSEALRETSLQASLEELTKSVESQNFYKCLKILRQIKKYE